MRKYKLSDLTAMAVMALVSAFVLTAGAAQAEWAAYNDCVYDGGLTATDPNGQTVHYIHANATDFGIGTVSADSAAYTPGTAYPNNSGTLLDISDGSSTGATLTITQNGAVASVNWQPQVSCLPVSATCGWHGGYDTASGTDAYDTFNGIVDMTGVTYYSQDVGWWVDYEFTGLDPNEAYTFACSAARSKANTEGDPGYPDRRTVFTLSGDDASTNSSTTGTVEEGGNPNTVSFVTGNNHDDGYVVRWTDIDPGADGAITVRAEAHSTAPGGGRQAYACSVLLLEEQASAAPPGVFRPVPLLSEWGYGVLLLSVFGMGAFALRRRKAS